MRRPERGRGPACSVGDEHTGAAGRAIAAVEPYLEPPDGRISIAPADGATDRTPSHPAGPQSARLVARPPPTDWLEAWAACSMSGCSSLGDGAPDALPAAALAEAVGEFPVSAQMYLALQVATTN